MSLVPIHINANDSLENMQNSRMTEASRLMEGFAQRTGLDSDRPQRRYLWTDAFAVCNFLGLARLTGEQRYQELAIRLIDQVHHVLGRHRDDDTRSGWISGLSEQEGEMHPTRGGLRIGKQLQERDEKTPFDERMEWERDGQYFHYLTKWMHALDQASHATANPEYNLWARELATTAYNTFTYFPAVGRTPRMYWKMSIDLRRPLVPSMGQHDPIDGYITTMQLRASATKLPQTSAGPDLENVIHRFGEMTDVNNLASADPLGIGGLLVDAYRVLLLIGRGVITEDDLLGHLLSAALVGLEYYAKSGELRGTAEYRLAFRELGLAIGLHALEQMWQTVAEKTTAISRGIHSKLEMLIRYRSMGEEIELFWLNTEHQDNDTWMEHQDINEVMLATTLTPGGFFNFMSLKK